MKKYSPEISHGGAFSDVATMEEDPQGEFVKFEDVKAFVKKLNDIHGEGSDEEDDYAMVRWHLDNFLSTEGMVS